VKSCTAFAVAVGTNGGHIVDGPSERPSSHSFPFPEKKSRTIPECEEQLLPVYWVVLVGFALVGIPVVAWMVSIQTILQTATDEAYLGRIFGAFGTTTTLLMLFGSVLGGGLGDLIGAAILVNVAGFFYIIGGVLAIFLLVRPQIKKETEAAALA
jgi:MFS family permease